MKDVKGDRVEQDRVSHMMGRGFKPPLVPLSGVKVNISGNALCTRRLSMSWTGCNPLALKLMKKVVFLSKRKTNSRKKKVVI